MIAVRCSRRICNDHENIVQKPDQVVMLKYGKEFIMITTLMICSCEGILPPLVFYGSPSCPVPMG